MKRSQLSAGGLIHLAVGAEHCCNGGRHLVGAGGQQPGRVGSGRGVGGANSRADTRQIRRCPLARGVWHNSRVTDMVIAVHWSSRVGLRPEGYLLAWRQNDQRSKR